MPVHGYSRASRSEEQRVIVAHVHGRHRGQKLGHVLRIEMAGSPTIVLEALPPSLTRIDRTDIMFEPDVQQLSPRRSKDLIGIRA